MKITRIAIKGYQQFRDFDLELVDPKTRMPLDRVCFIGPNGTGKTTLLRLILETLTTPNLSVGHDLPLELPTAAIRFSNVNTSFVTVRTIDFLLVRRAGTKMAHQARHCHLTPAS